ncbi:MAG: hypothetical protein AAGK14_05700 [Verrucomicrobiota bacterium]
MMPEPEDKPKPPANTPPPLPPKAPGKDARPPIHKPTARVPAVGESQPAKPFRDPFALDEEADTSSIHEALENLPPPLPENQPMPKPAQPDPRNVPVKSGQTMRIELPGQEGDAAVSNPGKSPVKPQRPIENKPKEPALLPGAYTQQLKPPGPPTKGTTQRLPKEKAQQEAEKELSKIEGWLSGQIEGKPESASPGPPPLPPSAKSPKPPDKKGDAKPAEAPAKREGPPRLSTVRPVAGTAPAPKERPGVEMPKMKMLDKKPAPLLSRQRRQKKQEIERQRREERMRPVPRPPASSPESKAKREDAPKTESVKSETPPPLPPPLPSKLPDPGGATTQKMEAKPVATPAPEKKAPEEKKTPEPPKKNAPAAKQSDVASAKPEKLNKSAGPAPSGEAVVKPQKVVQSSLPKGTAVEKKEPLKGSIPSAKPVKATETKIALPTVVPVAAPDKAQGSPVKPTKTADASAAKPIKAAGEGPAIVKPRKADEAAPEKAAPAAQKLPAPSAQEPAVSPASEPAAQPGSLKELSFPKVDHTNKKPAPLLSRQRRQQREAATAAPAPAAASAAPAAMPGSASRGSRERASKSPAPRQLSAMPGTTDKDRSVPAKPESPLTPKQRLLYRIAAYAALVVVVLALGYLTYIFMRETRVVGEVLVKPGSGFKIEEVAVVNDFRGDLYALARDLAEERQPLKREIRDLERNVALAKEDMVGREARLQYLREDILKEQGEIDNVLSTARTQAEQIWEGPGKELDEEYETKLEETRERIGRRAEQLGLDYNPSDEFDSPEVWVNAFRLALYDAPTGVNAGQERLWAESVLREWQGYNQDWRTQLGELKTQVQKIQATPREQIEDIRRNIADLKARIAQTEAEVQPLRDEINFNEARLQEKRQLEASLEEPKYKQVLQSANPEMIKKAFAFDPETNRFEWNEIQADPRFQPGRYLLWVRATRNGEEYWAFAAFSVLEDTTVQLIVDQTRLQSVRQALRSAVPAQLD